MNLNKDAESWARVSPSAVSKASEANIFNVLTMALEDIAKMAAEIERLKKERDDAIRANTQAYAEFRKERRRREVAEQKAL